MRRWILVTMLLSMLAACQSSAPETPTAPALTPTATPVPLASPEQLTAWKFYEPRDPMRQDLIIKDGDSYRLDPTWKVKSIRYAVNSYGLGSAVSYETIDRVGDGFQHETQQPIKPELVDNFLGSIKYLFPVQSQIPGLGSANDCSIGWAVELLGDDGRRLTIQADDNGCDLPPVWTVIDNGRLYAQYDNSIIRSVGQLFEDDWLMKQPHHPASAPVEFRTGPLLPPQLRQDFEGLLPIRRVVSYTLNSATGDLALSLDHVAWQGVKEVKAVEIKGPDRKTERCQLKDADIQLYTCAVGQITPGARYRYPTQIGLAITNGKIITTEGELIGIAGAIDNVLPLPLPLEIAQPLKANQAAADLLRDHILRASYSASISATNPFSGVLVGGTILHGQLPLDGRPMRYQVYTPFAVENGQLTHWDLSRSALETFLQQAATLSLTQYMWKTWPEADLWLVYRGVDQLPEIPLLSTQVDPINIAACGRQAAISLPAPNQPLRLVGFGDNWVDFILLDGRLIASSARFWPDDDDFTRELRPASLAGIDQLPYHSIQWHDNLLEIELPDEMAENDRKSWEELAATLPGHILSKAESQYASVLTIRDIGLVLNQANKLEFVACE